MTAGLGIRPQAIGAWVALHRAIADAARPTPCRADPDSWAEPVNPEHADAAAALCQRCPVIDACRRFADANTERTGIWAGTNRTPKRGRPKAAAQNGTAA